jgi:hypothetical protein
MNDTPFDQHRYDQLQKALAFMGGTHTLQDIVEAIATGAMQSFSEGETWCVTQVLDLPRKRVLEIVLLIGDMTDAEMMHDRVMNYAIEKGCTLVRTFARVGWSKKAREYGWKTGYSIFLMDL